MLLFQTLFCHFASQIHTKMILLIHKLFRTILIEILNKKYKNIFETILFEIKKKLLMT